MSVLAGGMAACAGELPMREPAAEAAAAPPAICRRRRLLTEEDILHPFGDARATERLPGRWCVGSHVPVRVVPAGRGTAARVACCARAQRARHTRPSCP